MMKDCQPLSCSLLKIMFLIVDFDNFVFIQVSYINFIICLYKGLN